VRGPPTPVRTHARQQFLRKHKRRTLAAHEVGAARDAVGEVVVAARAVVDAVLAGARNAPLKAA